MLTDGKQAPLSSTTEEFVIHEGGYQIPVYYERIPDGIDITMQRIMNLPKIQCATILLRCYPSPRDKKGRNLSLDDNLNERDLVKKGVVREPSGPYESGIYNNYWCFTDRDEQQLYKFKHKRINPPLNMAIGYLFQAKGIVRKGNVANIDSVIESLNGLFGKVSLSKARTSRKYENAYEQQFGFKISIEKLSGLKSE